MATIVCDSSSLISLSETCNIEALDFLSKRGAQFLIPPGVRTEIVKNPLKIRKFQFSAVRLRNVLDQQTIGIESGAELARNTNKILFLCNNLFFVSGRPLWLVHQGEAECVALCMKHGFQKSALLIDEKTTRLLLEDPRKLLEKIKSEYSEKIEVRQKNLDELKRISSGATIIRSAEILAVAAEKGFFQEYGKNAQEALHAGIYALKEAGCSLSSTEIKDYETIRL